MATNSDFCPHCGSTNIDFDCSEYERGVAVSQGRRFYFVFCDDCQASGPTDYMKERALELWRQRATKAREP